MRHGTFPLVALAVVLLASSGAAEEIAPAPVSERDIGLAKGSVFDVLVPPVAATNTADPGDAPPVAPAFDLAPARVPHAVADFMPISRDDNWCVDCHLTDWTAPQEGEATPIPSSHYMDLRNGDHEIGDTLIGARWVCVSCHVPVTDAPPLVANTFGD